MHRRPWPLVVFAFFLLGFPFANILGAYCFTHQSLENLFVLNDLSWWSDAFFIFGLYLGAALAVFWMKPWSYFLAASFLIYIAYYNVALSMARPSFLPAPLMLTYNVFNCFVAAYFLSPSVRKFYFNKTVRWWDTDDRYLTDFQASLDFGETPSAQAWSARLKDISRGGCRIDSDRPLNLGDVLWVYFTSPGGEHSLRCRVLHRLPLSPSSYGLRFESLELVEREKFFVLLDELQRSFPARRPLLAPWKQDLLQWLKRLVKSGRGWLPETAADEKNQ